MKVTENIDFAEIVKKRKSMKPKLFYEQQETKARHIRKIVEKKGAQLDPKITHFNKTDTSKAKRIKRRTLRIISIDKYVVRDNVHALRGFSAIENKDKKIKKDFINIQIVLSKKAEKVTVKPFLLYTRFYP